MAVTVAKNGADYEVKIDVAAKDASDLAQALASAMISLKQKYAEQCAARDADARIADLQAAKAKAESLPA